MIDHRVLVQARMSSNRFPGKMLAKLDGRPLIAHVLSRVQDSCSSGRAVLLTSDDSTDDRLAEYVSESLGFPVFRGDLHNVHNRYRAYLELDWCDWFVRISGDSPLIDPDLIRKMVGLASEEYDLITNVLNRTFPSGQSIEVVNSRSFLGIPQESLMEDDREHVTKYFYRSPDSFNILSLVTDDESLCSGRLVVDTPEDLRSIEDTLAVEPGAGRGYSALARLDRGCDG